MNNEASVLLKTPMRIHNRNALSLLNLKKKTTKFPYLQMIKEWKNLKEEQIIENLAVAALKYQFESLEHAIRDKACLILSFNLPKEIRRNLEKIVCDENENSDNIENLLNTLGIRNDVSVDVDSDRIINNDIIDSFLKEKELEIKQIFHYEKFEEKDRKLKILEKSIKIFIEKLKFSLITTPPFKYGEIFFSNFIIFFTNYISFLSGLKCHYTLDKFKFLMIEFYGDDEIYDYIAETNHYFLNLKILADFKVHNLAKGSVITKKQDFTTKKYDEKLKKYVEITNLSEKNEIQYENIDHEDFTYFTPYLNFNFKKKGFFRKYTPDDLYHDCEYTREKNINISKQNEENKNEESNLLINPNPNLSKCDHCSIYRNIDKLRLIQLPFKQLVDLKELKKLKNFKLFALMKNQESYHPIFQNSKLLYDFLAPYDTLGVTRLNWSIRNFFGEKVAYYFVFVSHYLKWLLIPSLISLIYYLVKSNISLTKPKQGLSHKNYLDLSFIFLLVIWAIFYTKSWASNQKFYNEIWGMQNYQLDEIRKDNDDKAKIAAVYVGVHIPIKSKWRTFIKRFISIILSICIILLTMFVNILLFYFSNIQVFEKHSKFLKDLLDSDNSTIVKSNFWYTILPIISVVIRNLLSNFNYSCAESLVKLENHDFTENYENSLTIKIVCFEFVNYYFGLFYIAYLKRFFDSCAGNSCTEELGHQLAIIIITSTILNIFEIGIPFVQNVYRRSFLKKLLSANKVDDPKMIIYYRNEYYEHMIYEYNEILLGYGYVILFGISSPICFLFTLFSTWIERFVDCYKLINFHNVSMVDGSFGIGINMKILKVFTLLGIFTNTSIAFMDIDYFKKTSYKWQLFIGVENLIILVFFMISFNSLPSWFNFLNVIRFNYVNKVLGSEYKSNLKIEANNLDENETQNVVFNEEAGAVQDQEIKNNLENNNGEIDEKKEKVKFNEQDDKNDDKQHHVTFGEQGV